MVTDFTKQDLTGSVFEDVDLTRARFHDVDLAGADFRLMNLTGVRIRDALLVDMDISGQIRNLRVNGIDVVPLVEAELNRRYPDRAKMTPPDADGFREAWDILERLWQQTVARARGMAPELLYERVDGRVVLHRDTAPSRLCHGRLGEARDPGRSGALGSAGPAQ